MGNGERNFGIGQGNHQGQAAPHGVDSLPHALGRPLIPKLDQEIFHRGPFILQAGIVLCLCHTCHCEIHLTHQQPARQLDTNLLHSGGKVLVDNPTQRPAQIRQKSSQRSVILDGEQGVQHIFSV